MPYDPFKPGSVFDDLFRPRRGDYRNMTKAERDAFLAASLTAMRPMTEAERQAWQAEQWRAAMNAAAAQAPARRPEKVRGKIARGRINIELAPEEYRRR